MAKIENFTKKILKEIIVKCLFICYYAFNKATMLCHKSKSSNKENIQKIKRKEIKEGIYYGGFITEYNGL